MGQSRAQQGSKKLVAIEWGLQALQQAGGGGSSRDAAARTATTVITAVSLELKRNLVEFTSVKFNLRPAGQCYVLRTCDNLSRSNIEIVF
jgi:hypothetical protein